jgi:CRP-like cAMP-binding protein
LFNQNHSQNHLLAALPNADLLRIGESLELKQMALGSLIFEAGEKLSYLYFPTSCVFSLHYAMENGSSSEFSSVGNEGAVGLCLFLSDAMSSSCALVQTSGYAYRLSLIKLRQENIFTSPVMNVLLRYTQLHLAQVSQQAICKQHHVIKRRLCTWLLQRLDRSESLEITITQELMADAMGVRREGINEATQKLQKMGLIKCRRGYITVIDKYAIKKLACECYEDFRNEYGRLFVTKAHH